MHKDKMNCAWKTYSTTAALCFIVQDRLKTMWSIKFLVNSRAVIGEFFLKEVPNEKLLQQCQLYLSKLNAVYEKYSSLQSIYSGTPADIFPMTWQNFDDTFYLHDDCPWESSVNPPCFKIRCGISRHSWLSAGVDSLMRLKRFGLKTDAMLEMVLLASYQTSWSPFRVIIKQLLGFGDDCEFQSSPSKRYCEIAKENGWNWIGGYYKRYEPTAGFDYKQSFFGPYGGQDMEGAVGVMHEVVAWIERTDFHTLSDDKYKTACT